MEEEILEINGNGKVTKKDGDKLVALAEKKKRVKLYHFSNSSK